MTNLLNFHYICTMNTLCKFLLALTMGYLTLPVWAFTTRELPLPQVPDTLRDAPSRAAFIVLHFWDKMDFNDAEALDDAEFLEQSFANYASVMPIANLSDIMPEAADSLLHPLVSNPKAYLTVLDLAELYLYDYNSPVRYEQAYVPFIEAALADSIIDDATRLRLEYTLEEAKKNAPGSKLPDIDVIDMQLNHSNLSAKIPETPYSLLYLFDPDCSHCTQLISALDDDPIIKATTGRKLLSIIAVNILGEDEISRNSTLLPKNWISLAAADPEFNETEAFNLPSLPVMYLIDRDMNIILKEANPQQLLSKLAAMQK